MKKLYFILLCLGLAGAAIAQSPNQQWISVLNSGTNSVDGFSACNFFDVWYYTDRIAVNDNTGNVGIVGISDCDIINTVLNGVNGNTIQSNKYSSPEVDGGQNIISDNNNNFVSIGILKSGSNYSGLLTKINSSTGLQFQQVVSSPNYSRTDVANLRLDNNNNIYVAGVGCCPGSFVSALYKYSPSGNLLWSNIMSENDQIYGSGYAVGLATDPAGNVIFSGKRQSGGVGTYDVVIRKLDPNGNQLWQVYYNSGEDYLNDLVVDQDGNIYFTVEVRGVGGQLVKLNGENGSQIWSTSLVGGKVRVNANGNILVNSQNSQLNAFDPVSGSLIWSTASLSNDFATDASSRIYTIKDNTISILNSDGTTQDNLTFSIPGYTTSLRYIAASSNGFYVTGTRTAGSESKIFVAKYSGYSNETSLSYQLSQEKLGNCATSPVKLAVQTSVKVKTDSAGSIGSSSATAYGNILNDGGKTITRRGFCWGTSANPTLNNSFSENGSGSGIFSGSLSGLSPSTTYYLRAYAGTATEVWYGNEINFTTSSGSVSTASCGTPNIHNPNLSYSTMTDQDGNNYKTIVIGTQEWMAENLKSGHYRNGEVIPVVTDNSAWSGLTSGASCWYNNDSASNDCPYGRLYNWYTTVDTRGLCPAGWHAPSDEEWKTMELFLGMPETELNQIGDQRGTAQNIGGKLKSVSALWASFNAGATNESGFSALPSGLREASGTYRYVGEAGFWWPSTENFINDAWSRILGRWGNFAARNNDPKTNGKSIRCLKDAPETGSINSIDCGGLVNIGIMYAGQAASGVTASIPYTSGNGGSYGSRVIASTGVTGLTAILVPGNFAIGDSSLSFSIIGTPANSGNASFALNIGGQSCTFSCLIVATGGGLTDIDGNTYGSVIIGNQEWMTENLKVSKYKNGEAIPDGNSVSWGTTTEGAYSYYNNQPSNNEIFGKVYNRYTVLDPRGLCPVGWHVPSSEDWISLVSLLDPITVFNQACCNKAGGKMKSVGILAANTGIWASPNLSATNISGFSGLPGGERNYAGGYSDGYANRWGWWWSGSDYYGNSDIGFAIELNNYSESAAFAGGYNTSGFSVRCLKD